MDKHHNINSPRDVFKMLDLEHVNNNEFSLLKTVFSTKLHCAGRFVTYRNVLIVAALRRISQLRKSVRRFRILAMVVSI